MNNILLLTIILISGTIVNAPNQDKPTNNQAAQASQLSLATIEVVNYCELLHYSDKYDGTIVRFRAILIENHAVSVDGGDSHFSSPECAGEGRAALATDHAKFQSAEPAVVKKKERLNRKRDKHGTSRIAVTAIGRFLKAKDSGFGHLNWAPFKIEIIKIESVEKANLK
jgi:hypothetical protein